MIEEVDLYLIDFFNIIINAIISNIQSVYNRKEVKKNYDNLLYFSNIIKYIC